MRSPLSESAHRQLQAYVRGDLPLHDLYYWLVEHVIANSAEHDDPDLRATLGSTVLYLYEYQAGHRTKEEIRQYVTSRVASPVSALPG